MNATLLSKRAAAVPPSPIRKLAGFALDAEAAGKKVYRLNIGQPDIPTPDTFLKAVQNYKDEVVAYTPSDGIPQLREAWAGFMSRSLDVQVSPGEMLITHGASEALTFLFQACCDPGDEVVVLDPTYASYRSFAVANSLHLTPLLLHVEQEFRLPPFSEITSKISTKTKMLLICSPNNPTGTLLNAEEIQQLVDLAEKKNIFLVMDEVYREMVYDGAAPLSVLHVAPQSPNVVVVDSLSKRFSLCGARVGSIISKNAALREAVLRLGQARLSCPTIEQVAAAEMLNADPSEYVRTMIERYEKRRQVLFHALDEIPDISFGRPKGAFYSVVALPGGMNSEDFAKFMLTDFDLNGETIFVAPQAGFYITPDAGKDEIRMAFVLERKALQQSAEILKAGIAAFAAA